MELFELINNNTNYISILKNNNIYIENYASKNLILCKYKYNNTIEEPWINYCKGCVINTKTNQLVCVPPIKSKDISTIDISTIDISDCKIQNLIDGTMINLFYSNNEWNLSTRSNIGGNNKWNNKKSFKQLFNESGGTKINYDKLNKTYSYSFVLLHKSNRNVSYIHNNNIILVDIFDLNNNIYLNLDNIDINTDKIKDIDISSYKSVEDYCNYIKNLNIDFNWKGLTIKYKNNRYNFINKNYEVAHKLKGNEQREIIRYSRLYKEDNIQLFLEYYTDKIHEYDKYFDRLKLLINKLNYLYTTIFITKLNNKSIVPFELKPCIYELHKLYKSEGVKINISTIRKYIKSLESNRIGFILSYNK